MVVDLRQHHFELIFQLLDEWVVKLDVILDIMAFKEDVP